jgi:ribosomal protein S1
MLEYNNSSLSCGIDFIFQVPVYVQTADVSNGKLTLSLKQRSVKQRSITDEKASKKQKRKSRVGKMYELTVTNCTDDMLEVESKFTFLIHFNL